MKRFFLIAIFLSTFVCNATFKTCTYDDFKEFVTDAGDYLFPSLTLANNGNEESLAKNKLSDEDYKSYLKAREALTKLSEIPPNQFWLFTMKASEENTFQNTHAKIRGRRSLALGGSRDGLLGTVVLPAFYDKCGLEMGYRNHMIGFLWLKSSHIPIVSSYYLTPWFWYEGRKYLPQIWNDWYECWKNENNKEKPRKRILKALADDIQTLSYHVAPYVSQAINNGDNTLTIYFDETVCLEDGSKTTYVEWWDKEKQNYILPKCEGLDTTYERIKGKDSAYSPEMLKNMQIWSDLAKSYYTNPPAKPDYWYYRLDDNYDYDDAEAEEKLYNAFYPPSIPNQKSE